MSRDDDPGFSLIEKTAGTVLIVGELTGHNVRSFQAALSQLAADPDRPLILQLHALDIEDGIALTVVLNTLRELSGRVKRLVIDGAPQMLGHNLYRAGMLSANGAIELTNMRLDEASGP